MEEIMLQKAEFISNNRDKIISNLSSISYPLFKILSSNETLEDLEEYIYITNLLEEKQASVAVGKDERYILHAIIGYVDRFSSDMEEKEQARNDILRYNGVFEKAKRKVKVNFIR